MLKTQLIAILLTFSTLAFSCDSNRLQADGLQSPPVNPGGSYFQYQIINFDKFTRASEIEATLNRLGSDRWELVSVDRHQRTGVAVVYRYTMKRICIRQ